MASPRTVIETRDLSVSYYKRITAVRHLTLTVQEREIVAIIGPNGAGKTSSLRAIAGFLSRESAAITGGQVLLDGKPVTRKAPYEIAREGVALVPERDKVFLELTPLEHFRLCETSRATFKQDVERVLELLPALRTHLKRQAGYLSGGQRQMLALAAALFPRPRILLVDEFSQGLAPIMVRSLTESLRKINQDGMTILLVEQSPFLAFSLAKRVYILDAGSVVSSGTQDELERAGGLTTAYLGTSSAPAGPTKP